jgi:hypothetical protein
LALGTDFELDSDARLIDIAQLENQTIRRDYWRDLH